MKLVQGSLMETTIFKIDSIDPLQTIHGKLPINMQRFIDIYEV